MSDRYIPMFPNANAHLDWSFRRDYNQNEAARGHVPIPRISAAPQRGFPSVSENEEYDDAVKVLNLLASFGQDDEEDVLLNNPGIREDGRTVLPVYRRTNKRTGKPENVTRFKRRPTFHDAENEPSSEEENPKPPMPKKRKVESSETSMKTDSK
uniref:Uncharacterized protein n=1 Tax=Steinernema glaseri TaxID=37863 RepID=A0A1I8A6S0_9BILA